MELPGVDQLSDDDKQAPLKPVKEQPKKKPDPKPKPKTLPKAPKAKGKPKAEPKPAVLKRPASSMTESSNLPEPAAETELPEHTPTAPVLKRPAAATNLRAYKYMYHKKGMWGIKYQKREIVTAGCSTGCSVFLNGPMCAFHFTSTRSNPLLVFLTNSWLRLLKPP